ncbi:methionyl-tRNA formyltransferase [Actinomycetota bacterium]|nr:methionyl-tRNA formyltransferase [Actinomycetota bacterium]
MRIIFAGTPQVAVPALEELHQQHEIVAVLTSPDAPTGRGKKLTPSAVKVRALELGLSVVHEFSELADAELGVVVAYGKLFKEEQLALPEKGWVNLHFSLLPKYRGASPVQSAILSGDTSTGVTVFQLQKGMDDGPIVDSVDFDIAPNTTSDELFTQLSEFGAGALTKAVGQIESDTAQFEPQDNSHATYTQKFLKSDAKINWAKPAVEIAHKINAFSSNPGAWFELHQPNKPPLRVVAIRATVNESGELELLKVKPAGKNAMDYKSWINGLHGEYTFG